MESTDACSTLDDLAHEHFERVVSSTRIPGRAGHPQAPDVPLSATVSTRLHARGIDALWTHQAAAADALRAGRNVVVATGTASGKSLCYQIPIVESVVEGSRFAKEIEAGMILIEINDAKVATRAEAAAALHAGPNKVRVQHGEISETLLLTVK